MKKQLFVTSLMILFIFTTITSSAQCRKGRINGAHCCGAHIDENKNGICDYLEVQTKDSSDLNVKTEKNEVVVKSVKDSHGCGESKGHCAGCTEKKCLHAESSTTTESVEEDEFKSMDATEVDTTAMSAKELEIATKEKEKPYSLILISLISIGLYGFTWLLVKFKKIKLAFHRKIWNLILLLTFLVSCLFGFFLVIQLNYDFVLDWFKTVLYWHVQVGIGMTIIAVFHTIWHTKYYLNMFKRK